MVVVRRRDRAALGQERQGVRPRRLACGGNCLPLQRILVGLVEKHRELRAQRVGQPVRAQFVAPRSHLLRLALLALDRRERGLERIRRRPAVPALAPLVEVHRRAGERHGNGGGFGGHRRMAVIVARELGESELVVRTDFPQEIRIELPGKVLRIGEKRRRRGIRVAQQDRGRLDLQALAGRGLDLQRRVVVGENRPGLELALVLEKDVHGNLRWGQPPAGRPRRAL